MTASSALAESVFEVALPARPYPGLRPFSKDEWPIFFGRERMVDAVAEQLIARRFVVLHGASGSGKSSLIRAGLLPRLEQQAARGGVRWVTCTATPGDAPLHNLACALAELTDGHDPERVLQLRRMLNCGRDGAQLLQSTFSQLVGAHVCILLDQFEELFAHARRHGPQQATLLIDLLNGLKDLAAPELCIVLTMRSEFLGACAQFEGFAETVNATQHLLPRMSQAELIRAIREPATLYDGHVSAELARKLIQDAGGGQDQLPLIQHGLLMLHVSKHQRGSASGFRLSLADYNGQGGLARLLSDHADQVAASATRAANDSPGHGAVVEKLFRALTDITPDGCAIRRPQRLSDLVTTIGVDEATLRQIIDVFREEGTSFLRPFGREPYALDDYVDISHEALIRSWRSLSDPCDGWLIREFKDGLIWRSLLVQAESFERDASSILSPAATEERELWLERHTSAWSQRYGAGWQRVQDLMQASIQARDAQQREREAARQREAEAGLRELTRAAQLRREREMRRASMVLLLLLCVVLGLVWYANQKSQEALRQERLARGEQQAAEQARWAEEKKRQAAAKTSSLIANDVEHLRRAAFGGDVVDKDKIDLYTNSITKQLAVLQQAARLGPQVYIQIADEGQREAAQQLLARISQQSIDDMDVVGVSVEVQTAVPKRAELRCFGSESCGSVGQQLLKLINSELAQPKLQLNRLDSNKTLRQFHYELWFGPAPIVLRPKSASENAVKR